VKIVHSTGSIATSHPRGVRSGVQAFARRFGYDEPRARQVARLALSLFDATRRLHRFGPRERELLEFAALLQDVGRAVSHNKFHKHSYYLIRHGALEGFAPEEVQIIAAIARFHRGAPPKPSNDEIEELPSGARDMVIGLAAILRVAGILDRSRGDLMRNLFVLHRGRAIRIYADAVRGDAGAYLDEAANEAELWQQAFGVRMEVKLRRRSA
jgi:exopolyphosphatase/guanosine-5'-triphosphate,3'-diphosphate pyrophosphatase